MSAGAWVAFSAAAALGAPARVTVDRWVQTRARTSFPLGILVVNVSGCALLGVVVGLARRHGIDDDTLRVLGTGGLGAFTTFSTFSVQTVRALEDGQVDVAVRSLVATVVLGALAAVAGLMAVAVLV